MIDRAISVRALTNSLRAQTLMPLAMTVGLVALIVASAYVSVPLPLGPVPMTMQSLAVLMAGIWAGPMVGAAAVVTYIALAAMGLPVLAGGAVAPGLMLLMKPSFGYLVGFVAGAAIAGLIFRRMGRTTRAALAALSIGHVAIFVGGFAHLATFMTWSQAAAVGVLPFIAGTVVKIALGVALVAAGRGLRQA